MRENNIRTQSRRNRYATVTEEFDNHFRPNRETSNFSKWLIIAFRIFFTILLIFFMVCLSLLGGYLNRCRGGKLDLSHFSYWQAQFLSRLVFALPTGLLVCILACSPRGGFVIWILTWVSLFVSWSTYVNFVHDSKSQNSTSGIFDWMFGRQDTYWYWDGDWFRNFPGMSLSGLVWTFPAGYLLSTIGFRTTYAFSGCLMGFIYWAGLNSNIDKVFTCKGTECAEYYWGYFIWFILILSSITALFTDVDKRFNKGTRRCDVRCSKYARIIYRIIFEIVAVFISLILLGSVAFYGLVQQEDVRNKGQTFIGVLISSLVLIIAQIFRAGRFFNSMCYHQEKPNANIIPQIRNTSRLGRIPIDDNLPSYDQVTNVNENRNEPRAREEGSPLVIRNQVPNLPNNVAIDNQIHHNATYLHDSQDDLANEERNAYTHCCSTCCICLRFIERFIIIDFLRVIQFVIDIIEWLTFLFLILIIAVGINFGIDQPRFLDSQYPTNSSYT